MFYGGATGSIQWFNSQKTATIWPYYDITDNMCNASYGANKWQTFKTDQKKVTDMVPFCSQVCSLPNY
jgi:hypothetical protein